MAETAVQVKAGLVWSFLFIVRLMTTHSQPILSDVYNIERAQNDFCEAYNDISLGIWLLFMYTDVRAQIEGAAGIGFYEGNLSPWCIQ